MKKNKLKLSDKAEDGRGFSAVCLRLWRENKVAVFCAAIIIVFILAAILAPVLTPYGYDEIVTDAIRLAKPSSTHPLGTDEVGRDVLTRILYGARISLLVGIVPTVISMVVGAFLGILAGFAGGKTDTVIMRLADIMLAFPSMLLAMVIMYTLGDGIINIFLALALVNWASVARIVRAETLKLKESEYIEAAKSIGVSKWKIMIRHILPNCIPSLIVLFTLNIPSAILSESSLGFLGLGIEKPMASWGLMVSTGRQYLYTNPLLSLAPSAAIMIIVLAFNFLGDGLRDVLDPHLKKQ